MDDTRVGPNGEKYLDLKFCSKCNLVYVDFQSKCKDCDVSLEIFRAIIYG